MKKLEVLLRGIIIGMAICMVVYALTSCRTGYGCRGRESWGHMVSRINSGY